MTHAQRTLLLDRFYRITEIPMLFLSICFLVIFFINRKQDTQHYNYTCSRWHTLDHLRNIWN